MATFPMSHISLCLSLASHLNLYFLSGSTLHLQDSNHLKAKHKKSLWAAVELYSITILLPIVHYEYNVQLMYSSRLIYWNGFQIGWNQ